jgi:FAD/FMN-containing dehydrogenase
MAPDASSTKIDDVLKKLYISKRDGQISDKAKSILQEQLSKTNATILFPDSDGYEENIKRWSDTCELRAAAVVLVTNEKEVQVVVNICRENAVPFVVAGGRHSTSMSNAIEDGIVIDLRKMRKVTVDAEKKTITAQGGAIWEDVDVEAAKYGLATPGGMFTLM